MSLENLENLILEKLSAYFPDMDIVNDAAFRDSVITPVLEYLGADPIDTDVYSFIKTRIKDNFPHLVDIDSSGSSLDDLLLKPMTLIFEAYRRELEQLRLQKNLKDPENLSSAELEALLANVFVTRTVGQKAYVTARVYFANPTSVLVDPSSYALANNGQLFIPTEVQSLSADDMALNVDGSYYYFDINFVSVEASTEASIPAGAIVSINALPGYIKITNLAAATPAIPTQTDTQLYAYAKDSITERSLVGEKGIKVTVMENNPTITDVSTIGLGDDDMTRDILSGQLTARSGLGWLAPYAGGHEAYFDNGSAPAFDFPWQRQAHGLCTAHPSGDWYTADFEVGDLFCGHGESFTVTSVGTQPNHTTGGAVALSGYDVLAYPPGAFGRISIDEDCLLYYSPMSGGEITSAPLFCTNKIKVDAFGGATPAWVTQVWNSTTDFLAVVDTTAVAPNAYYRSKFFPINKFEIPYFYIYSNNAAYEPRDIRIIAGGGPVDLTKTTAAENPDAVSLGVDGVTDLLYLTGGDNIDFTDLPDGSIEPGDFITLFRCNDTLEVLAWFEVMVGTIDSASVITTNIEYTTYINDGVGGGMIPNIETLLGVPGGWPADFRFYWTVRKGTGTGTTLPVQNYSWPMSFAPAWVLPTGYTEHADLRYRPYSYTFPDNPLLTNDDTGTNLGYDPWVNCAWAAIRCDSSKLPAYNPSTWTPIVAPDTPDIGWPYPFGQIDFPDIYGLTTGASISYPIRFYGTFYSYGFIDRGDPIAPGVFSTDASDHHWVMSKPAASTETGLAITLGQVPELVGSLEVPPDTIHVGGMADVYCKTARLSGTSMTIDPACSFVDTDVVYPPNFTGTVLTGGTASGLGGGGPDDGKFEAADLAGTLVIPAYTFTPGDALVITGPPEAPYYHKVFPIVGKTAVNAVRVYPPFSEASDWSGLEYVIVNKATMELAPVKLYKIQDGTDLRTDLASPIVVSLNSDFVHAGVEPGDTLYIKEGADLDTYTVVTVSNNTLVIDTALTTMASGLEFDVYTRQGVLDLPCGEITSVSLLDVNGTPLGVTLPYGTPYGAVVTATAMRGNSLVLPNAANSATQGETDPTTPNLLLDATVDFTALDIYPGDILYIHTGAYAGPYRVVGTSATAIQVAGLNAVTAEVDLEYSVGPTVQGSARCFFSGPQDVDFTPGTEFTDAVTGRTFIPDPDTETTIYEILDDTTDITLEVAAPIRRLLSSSVDFAALDIRPNSSADLGLSGDSDLVYLLHQAIVGSSTAGPLYAVDGFTFALEVDGRYVSIVFPSGADPSGDLSVQEILNAVNNSIPTVKLTEDATVFTLYSTHDVVVQSGTANPSLGLTAGATNVLSAAAQGPFRIAPDGVDIAGTYPPIGVGNPARIELILKDVTPDTNPAISAITSGLHIRVVRPGTQRFLSEDMLTDNGLYYVDVDVAAKYPGPDQLSEQVDMKVTGAISRGFTYATDAKYSFSPVEPIAVVFPTRYMEEDGPRPILGAGLRINYTHSPDVVAAHYFMQSKEYRTAVANILAFTPSPATAYVSAVYRGAQTETQVSAAIKAYLLGLPIGATWDVYTMIMTLKRSGILLTEVPDIRLIYQNKEREYQVLEVVGSTQLPAYVAIMDAYVTLTRSY